MNVKYKSNANQVIKHYDKGIKNWLSDCGDVGLKVITKETPVRTGELKSNNKVEKEDRSVTWYNNTEYASYVELGTYKMFSNPFMRRGLLKSIKTFTSLLRKYF